jgi:hypothetical protein
MTATSCMRRFVNWVLLYASADTLVKSENGKTVAGWRESQLPKAGESLVEVEVCRTATVCRPRMTSRVPVASSRATSSVLWLHALARPYSS